MTWARILLVLWPCISSTSYAFVALHDTRVARSAPQFHHHAATQNAPIFGSSRLSAASITMNTRQEGGLKRNTKVLPQTEASSNRNHPETDDERGHHHHHHDIMEASNAVKKTVQKCLLRSLTGELGDVGALTVVLLMLSGEVSLHRSACGVLRQTEENLLHSHVSNRKKVEFASSCASHSATLHPFKFIPLIS
jgi:hypothetical protein